MHAQNKPLIEYGELNSQHHADKNKVDEEFIEDDSPPELIVADGPGNLSVIMWTKGEAEVPQGCQGGWNHKGKAQDAINSANDAIRSEASAVAKAEFKAKQQAIADQEAIDRAIEVTAEKERIQADIDAQIVEASDEEEKPVKKVTRKYSGK